MRGVSSHTHMARWRLLISEASTEVPPPAHSRTPFIRSTEIHETGQTGNASPDPARRVQAGGPVIAEMATAAAAAVADADEDGT